MLMPVRLKALERGNDDRVFNRVHLIKPRYVRPFIIDYAATLSLPASFVIIRFIGVRLIPGFGIVNVRSLHVSRSSVRCWRALSKRRGQQELLAYVRFVSPFGIE